MLNRLVVFHKILQGSVTLNLPHEVSLLHTITRGHDSYYQISFSRIDLVFFQLQLDYRTNYPIQFFVLNHCVDQLLIP